MTWFASAASDEFHIRVGSDGGIQKNTNPYDPAVQWTNITSGTVEDLYGVAWAGFNFLAVGAAGTILRSDATGETWTPVVLGWVGSTTLNACAADNPVYAFCGDGGVIGYSSNGGFSWVEVTSGTTENLNGIDIGNAQYVAVGDNETIVVGAITSTFLSVAVTEVMGTSDTLAATWKANVTNAEDMEVVGTTARGLPANNVIPLFVNEYVTLDSDPTQDVGGDPQSGEDEVSTDLDAVITEAIVAATGGGTTFVGDWQQSHHQWLIDDVLVSMAASKANWTANALAADISQLSDRLFINSEIARDGFSLSDGLGHALGFSVTEAIALSEDLQGQYGLTLRDAFELVGSLGHNREVTASEHVVIDGLLKISWLKSVLDSVDISDDLLNLYRIVDTLADSVDVTDASDGVSLAIVVLDETIELSDTTSVSAVLRTLMEEGITFGISLSSGGELIDAWVINADTYGASRYEGYDFTSMATSAFGDFGINAQGVYELEGSDDDGVQIDASISTGDMDFSTGFLKNVQRVYLGMRSDGKMGLKTITDQNIERWYRLEPVKDGMQQSRVKLHRGVKSTYWKFELSNVDGGDFELESVRIAPITLQRRIRRG